MGTTLANSSEGDAQNKKSFSIEWFKKLTFEKELSSCKSIMKDPSTERQYLVITNTFAVEQEANKFIRSLTHKYLSHMPADRIQTFSNLKDDQEINN